jgi:alkylation response protein AidB-like acyl-CoA dehydrogenase
MDLTLSSEQKAYYETCCEFAKKEITPFFKQIEEDLVFCKQLYCKMAEQGLFGLTIPKNYGGYRTDSVTYALAMIAISKADAGLSVAMSVTNMVAEAILNYGSDQQKKRYLPKIANGDLIPAAFALTESGSGSDAKSIQMLAVSKEDNYILNGTKQFISNADLAGIILILAKTNAQQAGHGISAFLLEKGNSGFQLIKKENKSAHLTTFKLENCCIHKDNLLGPLNEGFKIAMTSLDNGRLSIAAQSIGIGEAAYELALHYAKQRKQFGQPLTQFQAISFKLADMHVKLSAGKLLLYKACLLKDQGLSFTLEASEAKLFCSEACNEIANEALQIHGGYGYVKDYLVEKYFRDARATTLYEGTSEIQRLVIAKQIINSLSNEKL